MTTQPYKDSSGHRYDTTFAHLGTESLSDVEIADAQSLPNSALSESDRKRTCRDDELHKHDNFLAKQARRIARNPCKHLCIGLVTSAVISAIGIIVGEFSVSVEAGGWQSRGTLIANRQTQLELAQYFADDIFFAADAAEEESAWKDLLNNVQKGWEVLQNEDEDEEMKSQKEERGKAQDEPTANQNGNGDENSRRQTRVLRHRDIDGERGLLTILSGWKSEAVQQLSNVGVVALPSKPSKRSNNNSPSIPRKRSAAAVINGRRLTSDNYGSSNITIEGISTCEIEWHGSQLMFQQSRLWPIWQLQDDADDSLSPQTIFDICRAEEETQKALVQNGLCFGCDGTSNYGCHRPFSVVLLARSAVANGMNMSCQQLKDAWAPVQADIEAQWKQCATDIVATNDPNDDLSLPQSCPALFSPAFVDDRFSETGKLLYTSSIFATRESEVDELYEIVADFDRAGDAVKGAYDTQNEDFVNKIADESLGKDMILAMASAVVIAAAMLLHTRSPFVTLIGLLQIILSFPVAFFFYKLIGQINYFPFLNFIGVFVIFALGADDVFVAFDKFKNARRLMPKATVEDVAAAALPEAVSAMFLTTSTTAIAFFATSICPVAPIKCFAIFLGLLVVFDYILNIVLVFPALCIYDNIINKHTKPNCCVSIRCCKGKRHTDNDGESDTARDKDATDENSVPNTLIQRILISYYKLLHRVRWPMLAICVIAFALSCYFASTLQLPTSGDVRVISESIQYEQNFVWRKNLLAKVLEDAGGSQAHVIWGVKPADTGNHNDPETWSELVLDDTFDPSAEDAQLHLLDFCPQMFEQDFASSKAGFQCSIQRFHYWLQEQAASDAAGTDGGDATETYASKCDRAAGLPMPPNSFHPCLTAWAKLANETTVLSRNERVLIITFPFNSKVRYDSEYSKLDDEWRETEEWMDAMNDAAPAGVNRAYFSSVDYWWYDTNGQMLQTAYGSAAIALAAAAVVILLSSRSFVLTLFATLAVGYVLTSVTACLVGIGWTLGFLESICFAILIGISVDFVVHFSHAYASLPHDASRGDRTKYALISMGPSILAAAVTSMASAVIMIFTVITFFQKFAYILLLTIFQSVLGSFVIFLVMSDCVGPSEPTRLVDGCLSKALVVCCSSSSSTVRGRDGSASGGTVGAGDSAPVPAEELNC